MFTMWDEGFNHQAQKRNLKENGNFEIMKVFSEEPNIADYIAF